MFFLFSFLIFVVVGFLFCFLFFFLIRWSESVRM